MAFLESSGSVERLSHPCVFAEEGLAMVFYPVQNLCKDHITHCETYNTTRGRSDVVLLPQVLMMKPVHECKGMAEITMSAVNRSHSAESFFAHSPLCTLSFLG